MTEQSTGLRIEGVTAGYGVADILHDISIRTESGLVTTIAGPNGAGKSTLVKTVAGLLKPRIGSVVLDGRDMTSLSPAQRAAAGLAYVPQERNVFRNLTVGENLRIGFEFVRRDLKNYAAATEKVFALFPDLSSRLGDLAGTLSGGQRQMLAMGCALIAEPRVLLLDEPSAGLSPRYTHEMLDAVKTINSSGLTVLLIEQNLIEAVRISHRVILLVSGRTRGTWPAADFLDDPTVRRLFLGNPKQDSISEDRHGASAA